MAPERRAALLLLALAVTGQGLRLVLARPGAAPGEVALGPVGPSGSPLAHRDSAMALARPLAHGERVDLDRASALEIARLPRVGLHLAKVIVADRETRGPFGGLAALDRVPGIGPGLLAALGPQVTFSSSTLPGATTSLSAGPVAPVPAAAVDLNLATASELERLPFIGPSLAARIVAFREKHGPFPAVDSLVRVAGIGSATLARLRERLVVH